MINERRDRRAGSKLALLMALAAIGLSGCGDMHPVGDPLGMFRDMTGVSADDARDQAPNSKNLAQGEKEPYPNLASVPKPPDNAITKADRDRLARSLIADRQNAKYTDEKLHAGQDMAAIPPPQPEPKEKPAPKVAAAPASAPAKPAPSKPAPSKVTAAPVAPVQREALAPPAPVSTPAPAPKIAAAPAPTPAPKVAAAPTPTPAAAKPTPKVAAAPPVTMNPIVDKKDIEQRKREQADTTVAAKKPNKTGEKKTEKKPDEKKVAKVKRGSEPPPDESALRPPSVGGLPVGEEAREAPPQPAGTPRSARASRSEEVAAATPPGDVEPAARRGKGETHEIRFSPGPFRAKILPADRRRLVEVAQLVERNHGRVRVVGYGGAPAAGDPTQREFQSFNAALDNAKAVGIELAKLGVPPSKIDIETAASVNSPDRAEVFVEY